jgi:hypothetical protein
MSTLVQVVVVVGKEGSELMVDQVEVVEPDAGKTNSVGVPVYSHNLLQNVQIDHNYNILMTSFGLLGCIHSSSVQIACI